MPQSRCGLWGDLLGLPTTSPHLFSSFLNDKEGVGAIRNGEGESVFEGVAAVVAVADTVLVDVFHSEGGGGVEMLPPGTCLDGAMPWRLHDGEGDGLSLPGGEKQEASWQRARGPGASQGCQPRPVLSS